jgi:hypothetical protein
MEFNLSSILTIGFLVMLAVLGHTLWHHAEAEVANFFVYIFTGSHVTG